MSDTATPTPPLLNGTLLKIMVGVAIALLATGTISAIGIYGEVKSLNSTVKALANRVDRIEDKVDNWISEQNRKPGG